MKKLHFVLVLWACLATGVGLDSSMVSAEQATTYPGTPAGRRLAWIVEGTNAPETFDATGQLTPNLEALASPSRLHELISEFHKEAGTLRVFKIRETSPFELAAVCRGAAGKHWRIKIRTDRREPHKLDSLSYSISDT